MMDDNTFDISMKDQTFVEIFDPFANLFHITFDLCHGKMNGFHSQKTCQVMIHVGKDHENVVRSSTGHVQ